MLCRCRAPLLPRPSLKKIARRWEAEWWRLVSAGGSSGGEECGGRRWTSCCSAKPMRRGVAPECRPPAETRTRTRPHSRNSLRVLQCQMSPTVALPAVNMVARSKENHQLSQRLTADTRKQSLTQLRKAAKPVVAQSRGEARRSSWPAAGMLVAQPAKAAAGSSLSNLSGSASSVTDTSPAPPQLEKPALAYGNICFDMAGQMHDIAALRERRNAAVTKGMIFMHRFFKKNNFAALHEIGDDAPSIFFECWYTSANSTIRMHAKEIFKQLYPIFETRLLQLTSGSPSPTPQPAAGGPPRRRRKSSVRLAAVPVAAVVRLRAKATQDAEAAPHATRAALEAATHAVDVAAVAEEAEEEAAPAPAKTTDAAAAAAAAAAEGDQAGGGVAWGGSSLQEAQDAGPAAVRRRNQACPPVVGGAASSGGVGGAAEGGDPEGGGGSAHAPPAARAATAAAAERPDRDDFFAFMFLARCKHEMGEDDEVRRSGT